jgi:adenylosuccinate lyase
MIARYSRPEMAGVFTDQARMQLWLRVEQATLAALVEEGIAPAAARDALSTVTEVDVQAVQAREAEIQHDLAAFVDVVGAAAPGSAQWLHYGLTSSDVVDTALALQLKRAGELILAGVARARAAVLTRAHEHRGDIMPGRTHGMSAEVITFGAKLAGWWHQLGRDEQRLTRAFTEVSVGKLSGAVGMYTALPASIEERVLGELGLGIDPSATQVVQRDRHAALAGALAVCAASLDRFATEVRHLQRADVAEAAEPFGRGQKGSSAMPHKRNPITAERICGLARVVRANAQVAFENVALWHERDISHSSAERVVIPDSLLALDYMLDRFTWIVEGMTVNAERMRANVDRERGLMSSQGVLLALAASGMARDDAYRIVQSAAAAVHAGSEPDLAAALRAGGQLPAGVLADLDGICAPERVLTNLAAVFERLPEPA